jgi:hypothetical protein
MMMAARWRSPRILDSGKTAMARLRSDLLNDRGSGGKNVIFQNVHMTKVSTQIHSSIPI